MSPRESLSCPLHTGHGTEKTTGGFISGPVATTSARTNEGGPFLAQPLPLRDALHSLMEIPFPKESSGACSVVFPASPRPCDAAGGPPTGEKMQLHRRRRHGPHSDHQQNPAQNCPRWQCSGARSPCLLCPSHDILLRASVDETGGSAAAPWRCPAHPSKGPGGGGAILVPVPSTWWLRRPRQPEVLGTAAPHWEKWTPGPKGPGPLFRSTTSRSHKNVCL